MSFRGARIKAGMSVPKVAESLNISRAAIYMWENGSLKPRTDRLAKVAQLYGCSIEELLEGETERCKSNSAPASGATSRP